MLSKHWVINIRSSALTGYIRPISISRGGNIRLFPKIIFQGSILESHCKYALDHCEGIERFRFENKARGSGMVTAIRSSCTITAVLLHSNVVTDEGTDGYGIR